MDDLGSAGDRVAGDGWYSVETTRCQPGVHCDLPAGRYWFDFQTRSRADEGVGGDRGAAVTIASR